MNSYLYDKTISSDQVMMEEGKEKNVRNIERNKDRLLIKKIVVVVVVVIVVAITVSSVCTRYQ